MAAAGNNGTDPEDALTPEGTNYCSYPACYKEVVAVGAVNCSDERPNYSQYNNAVDLVAPGVDILAALPMNITEPLRRGYLEYSPDPTMRYRNIGGAAQGGINTVRDSPVVDCGFGDLLEPCPVPKGGICFFQGRVQGLNAAPNVTFCDRVLACQRWGGAGVIVSAPFQALDRNNETIPYPPEAVPVINLDCSPRNCSCFGELSKLSVFDRLPVVVINNVQGRKILDGIKAGADANQQYNMTLATQQWYQGYRSGTSTATPFVTGAFAQVWAAFPNCTNAAVWTAFEVSAVDLEKSGKDAQYGYGRISVEKAYLTLAKQSCAQGGGGAVPKPAPPPPPPPPRGSDATNQGGGSGKPLAVRAAQTP